MRTAIELVNLLSFATYIFASVSVPKIFWPFTCLEFLSLQLLLYKQTPHHTVYTALKDQAWGLENSCPEDMRSHSWGMISVSKTGDLGWIQGKSLSQWGWRGTGTGCPEMWLMPHPRRLSRPGWSGPGQPDPVVMSLCIAGELDYMAFKGSFHLWQPRDLHPGHVDCPQV